MATARTPGPSSPRPPRPAAPIEVLNAAGWRVGDEIVLASTDFDPAQAERRTITAISGNTITLDQPLDYMHFGKITFGVDERGEVGLLTRNIRIQASDDAEQSYFGGHIMAMAVEQDVRLRRRAQSHGPAPDLARYPIHWHLVGEGKGQYIQNSAIHDTYSRCVTVHGTNNLRVENNVTYNTVGHCFFLEDGIETGNQFVRNLGIQTKCHPTLPCVPTNLAAAGIGRGGQAQANGQDSKDSPDPFGQHRVDVLDHQSGQHLPRQRGRGFRRRSASGSPCRSIRRVQFEGTEISANTWPRRTQLREFNGNTAHSNFDGLMFDRGPSPTARSTRRRQLAHGLCQSRRREQPADGVGHREFHRLQEPQWRHLGPRRACTCSGT